MKPFHNIRSINSKPHPSIGVLYNITPKSIEGREEDKAADEETIEIAEAIKTCIQSQDCLSELIELKPDGFDELLRYDWIFNLGETIYGFPLYDYQIAEELERKNIHFTGAGSASLKTCRDKAITKSELIQASILTPAYEVYPPHSTVSTHLTFPLFVKPLLEDGSFGITRDSKVTTARELIQIVNRIHERYQQPALVEEYIDGIDISVSILGNGKDSVILPLSEIVYTSADAPQFVTFPGIWIPESQEYHSGYNRCPANLDPSLAKIIAEIALRACQITNCRDYTRIDFRLKENSPYLLEVNPNPGISPNDSGFVRAAKAAGYSFCDLVAAILNHSMKRQTEQNNLVSIGLGDVN